MKPITAFDLAAQACRYADAVRERIKAERVLDGAYREWRRAHSVSGYIERHSAEWEQMMVDTGEEYLAVRRAKSRERHRRDRLVKMAGEAKQ